MLFYSESGIQLAVVNNHSKKFSFIILELIQKNFAC